MKKRTKLYSFPVIIERDEDGYYVGTVPTLRSCYTQARTLPELYKRLEEVVELCVQAERGLFSTSPRQNEFLGVQKLDFMV